MFEAWKEELFGIGDTEEVSMLDLSQNLQEAITIKGAQTLAGIPEDYAVSQYMVDSLTERGDDKWSMDIPFTTQIHISS